MPNTIFLLGEHFESQCLPFRQTVLDLVESNEGHC